MKSGSHRVDVPYRWPSTIRIEYPRSKLIYLDLNHWIHLSKANSDHPDGSQYREVLDACKRAVKTGLALFPISDSTYIEILKIRNHRQRCDLRKVIEEVCRFMVVTPLYHIVVHEIEALLDDIVGSNPRPVHSIDYVSWGAQKAFFPDDGLNYLDIANEGHDTILKKINSINIHDLHPIIITELINFNRQLIEGPSASEESNLPSKGWNPAPILRQYSQRAFEELEQIKRLNIEPRWRIDRIRDVVSARELAFEINSILRTSCDDRGVETLADIFPSVEIARSSMDSIPSFDVRVTLKSSLHRNKHHRWKNNDIHDIDALSSTIPYCDVVATDKSMASHIIRNGLDRRLNTVIISQIVELEQYLK